MKALSFALQIISIAIQIPILLLSTVSDTWDASINLSYMFLFGVGASFLAMILDERRGGISYMIEFFMLFFIAIPASIQINERVFPWFASLQPIHICSAFGILALSHISFQLGVLYRNYTFRENTKIKNTYTIALSDSKFYSRWAWIFALISILFAIAAGPSNLFVARFERADAEFGGLTQQFLFMCRSLSLLAMVMLLFLVKYSTSVKIKRQNLYILIGFIPFFLVINYLPALPRFVLFGIFISISTLFVNYFSPKIKTVVAAFSIVILFVVFPVIKSLGAGELDTSGFERRVDSTSISGYMLRVDFDAFMQITSTVHYYANDIGPLRYGVNFVGVALFFVPRAIWPGKPTDSGSLVAGRLGYEYTNVSSPLQAEALLGFGVVGPAFVFFLLAILVTYIERNIKPTGKFIPIASSFFAYAIMMGFIVIILRGALNAVAPQFCTAFLAFIIMMFLKKYKFVMRSN